MSNITLQEAKQIAEEAYIYGLQQAVFYETRFAFDINKISSLPKKGETLQT